MNVRPIVDHLLRAPLASPMEVLAFSCEGLVKAGVPVARGEAFVRTLHPNIAGRSFLWVAGAKVEVAERSWSYLQSPEFKASPMAEACDTVRYVERMPDELKGQGYTGFVACPLEFLTKQTHVITLATKAPGGFTAEHLDALREVVPAIARVGEIFALLRTATNLLNTYVGRNAGARILAGQIQLGDTDSLRAVIWFSDLRGFTQLTGSARPDAVIRALNELFGVQIPAIEKHGGEVLKFIGDGLLAVFPFDGEPAARCREVLEAAAESRAALGALNRTRTKNGDPEIQFGLALHLGEVSYGNIGGANRLDFTCIGPAVNIASRLEGIAGKLGRPIVLSEDFARHAGPNLEELGSFELKGVTGPRKAYAPLL